MNTLLAIAIRSVHLQYLILLPESQSFYFKNLCLKLQFNPNICRRIVPDSNEAVLYSKPIRGQQRSSCFYLVKVASYL
ncbi:hypothetical protein FGO68_gene3427 [Halteria grandinella]|uniref:Uncharacterized protein n=1 Tax=Halteria grandinella TaxID=5974 RepID=A0A8J8T5A2_HALGN|nr:hypothetical protein FGO68_gene3427 [Halteria grandinella]